MLTEYHAKYFACDLTQAGGKGVDRLGQSLFNAPVDRNLHQVEAALFALHSPLSKGVLPVDRGQNIRRIQENQRKILFAETPLQNSLSELYGSVEEQAEIKRKAILAESHSKFVQDITGTPLFSIRWTIK